MVAAAAIPGLAVAQEAPRRSELSAETPDRDREGGTWPRVNWRTRSFCSGASSREKGISTIWISFTARSRWLRKDWQTAIARFRAMLIRDPTLRRVRARSGARLLSGPKRTVAPHTISTRHSATRICRLSSAPGALAFLDAIRRRKTWSVSAAVALAPDSNINAATSSRQVNLFGLPAQLSEDARQTSGVGLNANISGGYEARISPDLRFRTGASLYTRTYEQSKFNDRTLTLRAGPRFLFEKFDLRPELTARARRLER